MSSNVEHEMKHQQTCENDKRKRTITLSKKIILIKWIWKNKAKNTCSNKKSPRTQLPKPTSNNSRPTYQCLSVFFFELLKFLISFSKYKLFSAILHAIWHDWSFCSRLIELSVCNNTHNALHQRQNANAQTNLSVWIPTDTCEMLLALQQCFLLAWFDSIEQKKSITSAPGFQWM